MVAIPMGAVVGGALSTLALLGFLASKGDLQAELGPEYGPRSVFPMISLAWLVGIVFLGIPAWLLLQWRGWTGPCAFVATGAAIPCLSLVLLAMVEGNFPMDEWLAGLGALACVGAIGAAVGWIIWRCAYRWQTDIKAVGDTFN